MNAASAWSVALVGMHPTPVEVEAAIGNGLPKTVLVGLPDTSLYEARDRCHAAVASSNLGWPAQLVTINLSPATLPKSGSHFDIAIVAAVMAAGGVVPATLLPRCVLMGELGLDGRVRAVRGVLPALLAAADAGFTTAIVPMEQLGEARLVEGLAIWGVASLGDLVDVLRGHPVDQRVGAVECPDEDGRVLDLADVIGQHEAKFALEVAAAGRHHLYLHGAPGVGKTMLAERLPGLLPDLTQRESLEVSALHSLAGRNLNGGLVVRPPYADPHHSASLASLIGGGARMAKPGMISLAHRGVLFMDEAPQFGAKLLDALRTPLESGMVTIGRSAFEVRYPARFQLVLAANPCPCGRHGIAGMHCRCSSTAIRRYEDRLSGPILDRIDITQQLVPMRRSYLRHAASGGEPTAVVADRVAQARQRQQRRLEDTPWTTNGELPGHWLRTRLPLPHGIEALDDEVLRGTLSSRGVDRVLRLAWTVSDLAGRDRPSQDDLHTAMGLRRHEKGQLAA